MKLLEVNKIELIQDRLEIENEIGLTNKRIQKLKDYLDREYRHLETYEYNLFQLKHNPNLYLKRKQMHQHMEDLMREKGLI